MDQSRAQSRAALALTVEDGEGEDAEGVPVREGEEIEYADEASWRMAGYVPAPPPRAKEPLDEPGTEGEPNSYFRLTA